ncbi:MAG: hypothetical protein J5658_00100 [Prevotella sp.]|nr:hypothetical protein [Prevotella sp.]
MEKVKDTISVTVLVADNSVPATHVDYQPQYFTLRILPTNDNKGYFGAIGFLMKEFDPQEYYYSIISNVDVLLTDNFFLKLSNFKCDTAVGWVAPSIYSERHQFDWNPQAMQRYSLRKLKILRFLFKHPQLLQLKKKIFHEFKDIKKHSSGDIYAGHGSFIILPKVYFIKCGIINYPVFLFEEEIYLAEECRKHGLKVVYYPQLKVLDIGGVSTGKIPSLQYCSHYIEALNYIISHYY